MKHLTIEQNQSIVDAFTDIENILQLELLITQQPNIIPALLRGIEGIKELFF